MNRQLPGRCPSKSTFFLVRLWWPPCKLVAQDDSSDSCGQTDVCGTTLPFRISQLSLLSLLGLTQVTPSWFWKFSSSTNVGTHHNVPLAHSQGRDRGCPWDWLGWSYVVAMINKEVQQTQPEKATWPEALNLHLSPGGQQRVQLRV